MCISVSSSMFRLCKKILHNRVSLNGDSTNKALGLIQNPCLVTIRSISTTDSDAGQLRRSSFTVSYLTSSFGLSVEKAVSASRKIQSGSSDQTASALALFRNYGLTNTQISKIIKVYPSILFSNADSTLKPKLEFFKSVGFSAPDLAKLISSDPRILFTSLNNTIIPSFGSLKTVLLTDAKVVSALNCSSWLLSKYPQKSWAPNVEILRAEGVPDANISMLLVLKPRAFLPKVGRFKEIVGSVKKMGFDPSKVAFVRAIQAFTCMSQLTREKKFDALRKWGWSEEDVINAFRSEPTCFALSEKTIMLKMDFFVNKLGFDPLVLTKYAAVLKYSMEKRIVPRSSVIKLLILNNLLEKDWNIRTVMQMSERQFEKKFIAKFEDKVPELSAAYQGRMNVLEPHSCTK